MNVFIHTISFKKHISFSEKTKLVATFKDNIKWIDSDKNYIIQKYSDNGITLKITKTGKSEQQYDKDHNAFKVEIIVNLYKLLHPGEEYGKVIEYIDLNSSINHLFGLLKRIEQESFVCLTEDLILKRVDVAKDIFTPNTEYALEIIRLSKISPKKYGYKNYTPDIQTMNKKWKLEDSSMFYSKNINAKIYNKKQDLINHNIKYDLGEKGLLRFEVSLKTRALMYQGFIENGVIQFEDLPKILYKITSSGEYLLNLYFKEILTDGNMLSKTIQNKYIKMRCGDKKKRIQNMKEYRTALNKGTEYNFTSDKAYRIKEHFNAIGLSPLYSILPFIPSFSDILDGKVDKEILNFAYFKSEDKNQTFWR